MTTYLHAPGSAAELAARARRIVDTSARAWNIAPASPHAQARRAPHGHVPLRVMRRLQSAARALGASRPLAFAW